jgi:HSP20 family molecular chaperone IbpA
MRISFLLKKSVFSYSLVTIPYSLILFILLISLPAFAADSSNSTDVNAATEKARQDYRVFLAQLKTLNKQYKQVTNEMSKIVKEEGVPSWDNNTDSLTVLKPGDAVDTATVGKNIEETDKEMKVSLDLPGLKKDSIKVSIQDVRMLRVKATRHVGDKTIEIDKLIELPAAAEQKGTQAKYEDGVLTVKIPKATQQEIQIPVN